MRETIVRSLSRLAGFGVVIVDVLFFENLGLFVFRHTSWLRGMCLVGGALLTTVVIAIAAVLIDSSREDAQ